MVEYVTLEAAFDSDGRVISGRFGGAAAVSVPQCKSKAAYTKPCSKETW